MWTVEQQMDLGQFTRVIVFLGGLCKHVDYFLICGNKTGAEDSLHWYLYTYGLVECSAFIYMTNGLLILECSSFSRFEKCYLTQLHD